eukprot:CAMPEP_0171488388 /NCGR_PEP_ID=MMETSP0958-20121227/2176_1 /TAXON_ID=87120 /ORGANISM="Aurantiochytrium limacinum, Strain ATCCMYA-1381" /LENGTH=77 /DNA_ID=CAMNT_0012021489 /DNA_START=164 /DNA_END=397 /DNA_ORIENTATION=+
MRRMRIGEDPPAKLLLLVAGPPKEACLSASESPSSPATLALAVFSIGLTLLLLDESPTGFLAPIGTTSFKEVVPPTV